MVISLTQSTFLPKCIITKQPQQALEEIFLVVTDSCIEVWAGLNNFVKHIIKHIIIYLMLKATSSKGIYWYFYSLYSARKFVISTYSFFSVSLRFLGFS